MSSSKKEIWQPELRRTFTARVGLECWRTMISWGLTGRTEAVQPLKSVLRSPVTSQQPHISLQRSLATQIGCKTPWYQPSSLPDCHSVQVRISPKVSSCYFYFCRTISRMFLHDVLGPWRVYSECFPQKSVKWKYIYFNPVRAIQHESRAG